ncbi:50S ribosomal protein L10 [Patescibacteria group bacterium]|jgi:large subunit ribosomal protein L10|nr:50S ribosomal protein L10 [Patescibacteria group bacterium]MCL5114185.1 50S ribosomal protein L10 [Patescibacteria group bacterium]
MKTKAQKKEQIETGKGELDKSETVVFTDFTGLSANDLNVFRKLVRGLGGVMVVMKKRLLTLALKEKGIDFDAKKLEGQVGVVFSPKDSVETANVVYQFGKPFRAKNIFNILGGFEVKGKRFMEKAEVETLGQLPSREVLLGQLAFMLTVPIKKVLFVLNEKAKQQ